MFRASICFLFGPITFLCPLRPCERYSQACTRENFHYPRCCRVFLFPLFARKSQAGATGPNPGLPLLYSTRRRRPAAITLQISNMILSVGGQGGWSRGGAKTPAGTKGRNIRWGQLAGGEIRDTSAVQGVDRQHSPDSSFRSSLTAPSAEPRAEENGHPAPQPLVRSKPPTPGPRPPTRPHPHPPPARAHRDHRCRAVRC
jgi:hypothetical protein